MNELPVKRLGKTSSHQIYRLKDGTKVPGGSTVSKLGSDPGPLLHWAYTCGVDGLDYRKVRDQAADIGTLAHFMIECHFEGVKPDLSEFTPEDVDKAENAFLKFLDFLSTEDLRIVGNEIGMVHEELRYGGTLDMIARDHKDRVVLIDWKTSKGIYEEYEFQVGGYEQLWNFHNPNDQVKRRMIVRIGKKEKGDFEIRPLYDMSKPIEIFNCQVKLYHAKIGYRKSSY